MTSAIGPVFDYLLTNIATVVTAVDPSASVIDGWANVLPDDYVVIGRGNDSDQEAASSIDQYILLGGQMLDEEFTIPIWIDCFRGGDDQSAARDAALAYFNAIVKFINSDLTLGGALKFGRYASLDTVHMDGPVLEDAEAGRRCQISFTLRCRNQYDPNA